MTAGSWGFFSRKGISALLTSVKVSEKRADVLMTEISLGSTPAPGFYALIALSSLIASIGLVMNSVAVVIGAMLVSPLMTPIFGMALAMVRGDANLMGRSIRAEVGGVIMAIGFAATLGLFPFVLDMTPEMVARTEPNLLDLLVAVLAGLAGSLAVIDERISAALPGVAISTAIVPPLSTCGLCFAIGEFSAAYGSFFLFLANFVAILLVSSLTFVICGLGDENMFYRRKQLIWRMFVAGISFVLMAAFLTHTLLVMIKNRHRTNIIRNIMARELKTEPGMSLDNIIHKSSRDKLNVLVTLRTPKLLSPRRVKYLEDKMNEDLDILAQLIVRNIHTKDVSPSGTTSHLMVETFGKTFLVDDLSRKARIMQVAEHILLEVSSDDWRTRITNMDLVYLGKIPVILMTVQSSRPLSSEEIKALEQRIRTAVKDPTVRLVARTVLTRDVTSEGCILNVPAHFSADSTEKDVVRKETCAAVEKLGDFFAKHLDVDWREGRWNVRAEIFGPHVITPDQVRKVEMIVTDLVGKPVKIWAISRAELTVVNSGIITDETFQGISSE